MSVDTRARDAAADVFVAVEQMQRSPVGAKALAGSAEGFHEVVERRRRSQRVVAIVVSLLLAALGFAMLERAFRSEPLPADDVTPDNVERLDVAWTGSASDASYGSVVGEGYVVTYEWDGKIAAYREDCASGGQGCAPLWTADVTTGESEEGGLTVVPVIGNGHVLVGGERCFDLGTCDEWASDLYSFPLDCRTDGGECAPRWVAPEAGGVLMQGAVATDGTFVYAGGNQLDVYRFDCGEAGATCEKEWTAPAGASGPVLWGDTVLEALDSRVAAFDVDCRSDGRECEPLWRGKLGTWGEPVVSDGVVYAWGGNVLAAYPVDCGTSNELCEPLWSVTRPARESFSKPIVSDGILYTSVTSFIPSPTPGEQECSPGGYYCERAGTDVWTYFAYPVECIRSGGSCEPLWSAEFREGGIRPGGAQAGSGHLYVVGVTDLNTPEESRQVLAFDSRCRSDGGRCTPEWVAPTGDALIAGEGLVFVLHGGEVRAYASSCGTGGATCEPVWRAPVPPRASDLLLSGRALLVGSKGSGLTVFALDGEVTSPQEGGGS